MVKQVFHCHGSNMNYINIEKENKFKYKREVHQQKKKEVERHIVGYGGKRPPNRGG